MADTLQSLGLLKPDFTSLPPDIQGDPGAFVNLQAYVDALRQHDALAGGGDPPPIDFRQQAARVLQAYAGGAGQDDPAHAMQEQKLAPAAPDNLPLASSALGFGKPVQVRRNAPQIAAIRPTPGDVPSPPSVADAPHGQTVAGGPANSGASSPASTPRHYLSDAQFNAKVGWMVDNHRSVDAIHKFAADQGRDPRLFRNLEAAVAAGRSPGVVSYRPPARPLPLPGAVVRNGSGAPDGAAEGEKAPESWWDTLKSYGSRAAAITPLTDSLINGRNFFDSLQDNAAGFANGVAQLPATLLHLGGGAVRLVGDSKDADTLGHWGDNVGHFGERFAKDPNSSAFGWGRFDGKFMATAPVEEVAPFAWAAQAGKLGNAGRLAKYADTAFQGALSGLATSGGKDMPHAMIQGALVPTGVKTIVEHGLPPVLAKVSALAAKAGSRKLAAAIRTYIPEEAGHAGSASEAPQTQSAPAAPADTEALAGGQHASSSGAAAPAASATNNRLSPASHGSKGERLQEMLGEAGTELINNWLESEGEKPEGKPSPNQPSSGTQIVANAVLRRAAPKNTGQQRRGN